MCKQSAQPHFPIVYARTYPLGSNLAPRRLPKRMGGPPSPPKPPPAAIVESITAQKGRLPVRHRHRMGPGAYAKGPPRGVKWTTYRNAARHGPTPGARKRWQVSHRVRHPPPPPALAARSSASTA